MAIPTITGDFIPVVQKTNIKRKYGSIDDTALALKITELQTDAEGFAKTYVGDITKIDDTAWIMIKKLYVEWMIYSQIEIEKISEDKRTALFKVLDNINKRTNGKDEDNVNKGIPSEMFIL